MQINIHTKGFTLTESLRNYAERRLSFALSCCDERIQRIEMCLSDINGPRGGSDKHCHLSINATGLADIVIEDIEMDIYMAIDRATDRGGRTVIRNIKRQQYLLRQSLPLKTDSAL